MDFYDELQEREQRRSIEANYQRHLRSENWPEKPHPDGCWNCGSYSYPTDGCTDELARIEAWGG